MIVYSAEHRATEEQRATVRRLADELKQLSPEKASKLCQAVHDIYGSDWRALDRSLADEIIEMYAAMIDELGNPRRSQQAPATEKQIAFIRSLVSERDWEGALSGNEYERAFDVATDAATFMGRQEASSTIEALLDSPRKTEAGGEEAPEGVHKCDGKFFKVQVAVHGSGKKYAKVLQDQDGEPHWKYVGRAPLNSLSESTVLTAEEAAEFGHLYGRCVFCGLPLTDERSIDVGYGPVCAENNALPWG